MISFFQDSFEMQADAIKPGQTVIVVDDLIATGIHFPSSLMPCLAVNSHVLPSGGSAKAAGELVAKQKGHTLEYLFIIELSFLKGGEKLDGPLYSVVQSDD